MKYQEICVTDIAAINDITASAFILFSGVFVKYKQN